MTEPRIGHLVTTWKGGSLLADTLASIPRGYDVEVISTAEHSWGLSEAWNYGIDMMLGRGNDVVVVCNDDIVLAHPPQFDFVSPHLAAALQGRVPDAPDDIIMATGYNLNPERGWPINAMRTSEGFRFQPHPDFSCFCVDYRLFQEVGRFDENLQIYFEDNDMHTRIALAGWEAYSWAPYWHFGSGTITFDAERQAAVSTIFERSKAYYISKWGGKPHHETFKEPFNGEVAIPR